MDSPISTNRRRGAVNTGTPYHGIADKPVLSISSGIHDFLLTLSISADEGCEVVFTLDGSDPDRDHVGGADFTFKNQYPRNPGNPFCEFIVHM